MNILFYSPVRLESGGGCERWHCDVTKSLKKQFGHDVRIVTANLGKSEWSTDYLNRQLAVPYTIIEFPILFGALFPAPSSIYKLYHHFKWADVIHVIHGFIGQDILVLLLKLLTGKKIILGWHSPIFHSVGVHNFYMKYVSRYLLNFFDDHMTLNASDKRRLEDTWGIKNVHFIPSGVRTERFLRLKRRPHTTLNFLTVGSYRANQKGIDLALEAIRLFNSKNPGNKAVFNFVGGGGNSNQPNIRELGFIKYEGMPKIYDQNDVYLLSSREEPFGLVLIEAWSSGMPVLATKTEGPLDMLKENQNGWFIDDVTASAISGAIKEVYLQWLKNSKFLKDLEKKCRQTGKMYSIDVTAQRMNRPLFV